MTKQDYEQIRLIINQRGERFQKYANDEKRTADYKQGMLEMLDLIFCKEQLEKKEQ